MQTLVRASLAESEFLSTKTALQVTGGVIGLALLAQVSIPLPFTPVPLTGQTFGVYLLALLFGRKRGLATVAAYLAVGAAGAPVFALGQSGLSIGPTMGYLVGMLAAAFVVGGLADKGFNAKFPKAWLAAACGSVCVFTFGLIGLSFFVPTDALLMSGLIPFIPGDLIKTTLAASMAITFSKR
jgi:biotin transport system substrate-specific component